MDTNDGFGPRKDTLNPAAADGPRGLTGASGSVTDGRGPSNLEPSPHSVPTRYTATQHVDQAVPCRSLRIVRIMMLDVV